MSDLPSTRPAGAAPSRPRPRIYLAGPDVFLRDNQKVFETLKAHCDRLGMLGVEPSDGGLANDFTGSDDERARRIYEGNIALIRESDGVAANLMDFRGHEPDSGTVFEVGFAAALGKPVVAYNVPLGSYAERIVTALPCIRDDAGHLREAGSGTMVEGLGQPLNLMLSCSTEIAPSAQEALDRLAQRLGAGAGGIHPGEGRPSANR